MRLKSRKPKLMDEADKEAIRRVLERELFERFAQIDGLPITKFELAKDTIFLELDYNVTVCCKLVLDFNMFGRD